MCKWCRGNSRNWRTGKMPNVHKFPEWGRPECASVCRALTVSRRRRRSCLRKRRRKTALRLQTLPDTSRATAAHSPVLCHSAQRFFPAKNKWGLNFLEIDCRLSPKTGIFTFQFGGGAIPPIRIKHNRGQALSCSEMLPPLRPQNCWTHLTEENPLKMLGMWTTATNWVVLLKTDAPAQLVKDIMIKMFLRGRGAGHSICSIYGWLVAI